MQVYKQTQGCIEYECTKCMSEHVCVCGQYGFALIMVKTHVPCHTVYRLLLR